jgi:hypothetical protein
MTEPTKMQTKFADSMSRKQWAILSSLTFGASYVSATERSDPELTALVEVGLAKTFSVAPDGSRLLCWIATEEGKTLVARHFAIAQ